jgi:hypothetical protein
MSFLREHPTNANQKGLIEFMEIEDMNFEIVVTKDVFKKGACRVLFIPIWLFLLVI